MKRRLDFEWDILNVLLRPTPYNYDTLNRKFDKIMREKTKLLELTYDKWSGNVMKMLVELETVSCFVTEHGSIISCRGSVVPVSLQIQTLHSPQSTHES